MKLSISKCYWRPFGRSVQRDGGLRLNEEETAWISTPSVQRTSRAIADAPATSHNVISCSWYTTLVIDRCSGGVYCAEDNSSCCSTRVLWAATSPRYSGCTQNPCNARNESVLLQSSVVTSGLYTLTYKQLKRSRWGGVDAQSSAASRLPVSSWENDFAWQTVQLTNWNTFA